MLRVIAGYFASAMILSWVPAGEISASRSDEVYGRIIRSDVCGAMDSCEINPTSNCCWEGVEEPVIFAHCAQGPGKQCSNCD